MSKYYYLVAGLPELTLEDSKLSYTEPISGRNYILPCRKMIKS